MTELIMNKSYRPNHSLLTVPFGAGCKFFCKLYSCLEVELFLHTEHFYTSCILVYLVVVKSSQIRVRVSSTCRTQPGFHLTTISAQYYKKSAKKGTFMVVHRTIAIGSRNYSWFIFKVNLLYNYDTPLFAKEFPPEIFDIFLSNFSLSSFWSVY